MVRTTRASRAVQESEDEDNHSALDVEDDEEPTYSSKKKKQPQTASSSSKRARQGQKEESDSEEEEDVSAIVKRRSTVASLGNGQTSSQPVFSSKKALKMDAIEARSQNVPVGSIKVGAPERAPEYQSLPKSSYAASLLSADDLSAAVGSTTRLVLARQLNGKPLTGSEIEKIVLHKFAGSSDRKDFNKQLLGYLRVEVAKRLKDVFGFELFAGLEELKMGDKWHIVNALESDEIRLLVDINQDADNEDEDTQGDETSKQQKSASDADMQRGALIVVLAIIMLHKGEVSEEDMTTDLSKFGMSEKTVTNLKKERNSSHRLSIPDTLGKLVKQGFLIRQKRDNLFYYTAGEKADNEIGKRAILQFMMQSCNLVLDENDEAQMLRL